MDKKHLFYVAKIAEAAIVGKAETAVAYLEQFVGFLESSGQEKEAERLQRILEKKSSKTASLARSSPGRVPIDSESALSIADREFIAPDSTDVILSETNSEAVTQFIEYIREADKLSECGVEISPTMLLYGAPGIGKTLTARFIASQLGLPLLTARSDGLISSYLGSTSKNVRRLFEFAMNEPCVLFLDEFDAIAKKRDDSKELGELKRVVISLLQNIDALDKNHILIAATNHDHLLDPAIWRRFTYRVHLELPSLEARTTMLRRFYGKFVADEWIDVLGRTSDGLSGAQIKVAAEKAIRFAVIQGESHVQPDLALLEILRETGRKVLDRDDMIRQLRHLDEKVFTESTLGKIVGISQPAIHKILTKDLPNGRA